MPWTPLKGKGVRSRIVPPTNPVEGSVFVFNTRRVDPAVYAHRAADIGAVIRDTPEAGFVIVADEPLEALEALALPGTDNVLVGVEVLTQHDADTRIPRLVGVEVPTVALVSPTEPIDLGLPVDGAPGTPVDWVIVSPPPDGGPMHPAWVRSLMEQSVFGEAAFRFDGWGRWVENLVDETPEERVLHVPRSPGPDYMALHISGS